MKTLKELSKEYADNCYAVNPGGIDGVLYRETMKDFEAGYKAAFRWISVEKELPNSNRVVIAMNEDITLVWSTYLEGKGLLPYVDLMFGEEIPATHWREIDLEG